MLGGDLLQDPPLLHRQAHASGQLGATSLEEIRESSEAPDGGLDVRGLDFPLPILLTILNNIAR